MEYADMIKDVAIWITTSGLTFCIGWIVQRRKDTTAVKRGLRAILCDNILKEYGECVKRGSVPIYVMQNIESMYNAYHALGGNGSMTEIYQRLLEMPVDTTQLAGRDSV